MEISEQFERHLQLSRVSRRTMKISSWCLWRRGEGRNRKNRWRRSRRKRHRQRCHCSHLRSLRCRHPRQRGRSSGWRIILLNRLGSWWHRPSASSAMELEEQRQAGDGGVTMVVVAEKCMNDGADNEESEHPQGAPQTSVLVLPPLRSVEEMDQQMVVVVEVNGFSKEDVWKRTGVGTGHHMVGVRGE